MLSKFDFSHRLQSGARGEGRYAAKEDNQDHSLAQSLRCTRTHNYYPDSFAQTDSFVPHMDSPSVRNLGSLCCILVAVPPKGNHLFAAAPTIAVGAPPVHINTTSNVSYVCGKDSVGMLPNEEFSGH